MLSKKSIERIAALSKLDIAVIETAIKSDKEETLTIPDDLTPFTAEELTARDNNMKGLGKTEAESIGETKGKELAIKAITKKLGITDAPKDVEAAATLIQQKLQGETALQDQIKLLQNDVKEKVRELKEKDNIISGINTDRELTSMLPEKRSKILDNSEHLEIVRRNLEFTEAGVKYKGEILRRGNTQDPLTKKEAIEYFYNQRAGLLEIEGAAGAGGSGGGRGGGNSGTGGAATGKTLKDVRKTWEAQNPGERWGNLKSQDYLKEVVKSTPDLVMEDDEQ